MRRELLSARLQLRLTARLKHALTLLFESDPKPYRSISEFVAAVLESIARQRIPHFFSVRAEDESGAAPARAPEPQGRPPRRISPPSPRIPGTHRQKSAEAVGVWVPWRTSFLPALVGAQAWC